MLADKLRAASLSARPLPKFISSSSAQSASSPITVIAPSGIQNGDLLVAIAFSVDPGETASVLPSGFKLVTDGFNTTNSFFIASKVASNENGDYTFQWTSASTTACILVYRNATCVNTIGSVAKSSTNTGTAPSITPSYSGTLVAVFCNESKILSTPPSGLTNRVAQSVSPKMYVYDKADSAAVSTGDYSVVWAGSATDNAVSVQLQITNEPTVAPEFVASESAQNTSSSTTQVVNKPAGTVEGDLMIAIMARGGTTTWTGDTGWTEVADQTASPSLRVAYKVAGASEPSSYTFTMDSVSDKKSACILTYRYAAYDTIGSFTTGTNPLVLPSISPAESQAILIAAGARAANLITLGTPTSMTARVTDNDGEAPSYIVCDQTVAKGPTGTRSMSTGSTLNVAGIMLSIKPTRSL